MSNGQLILISAPSGAGKTSLVNAALQQDAALAVSVSHTTRPCRPGEQDGTDYYFIDTGTFKRMVADSQFLEHAVVFGNLYGTARSQVDRLRAAGRDVILEIDWQGAAQVQQLIPEALSIFVLPPSEAHLQERLTGRGQDSAASIEQRLSEARLDMSKAHDFQYVVVNDDFDTAVADLLAVIRAARLRTASQYQQNPGVRAMLGNL